MAWLRTVGERRDKQGQPVVKKKQMDMLEVLANRIVLEIRALNEPNVDVGEPLLWCLHGLPGTGKTFVLKLLKELFEEVLGWEMGMEYQMAALQAVTAAELEGDTIHHALGINPFAKDKSANSSETERQKQQDVSKRVMQWRWLIIDEISR